MKAEGGGMIRLPEHEGIPEVEVSVEGAHDIGFWTNITISIGGAQADANLEPKEARALASDLMEAAEDAEQKSVQEVGQ